MSKLLFKEARTGVIIWLLGLIWLSGANVLAIASMFNTDELWREYVQTSKTPFGIIFTGPGIGLTGDTINIGLACIGKLFIMLCIAIVIVNVNYVVNWNRGFEEDSRTELLLALPVRRFSLQLSSVINLSIFNAIVSVAVGIIFISMNLSALDTIVVFIGFFLFSQLWMLLGLVGSAIFESAKSAKLATNGLFLLTFIIGSVGWVDAISNNQNTPFPDFPWYCWFSPLHWLFEIKPYIGNDVNELSLLPLLIFIVLLIILSIACVVIYAKRDMNSSLINTKGGRINASKYLNSIFSLRFKQIRTTVLIWAFCLSLLAFVYGAMMKTVIDMISDSEVVQQLMKVSPESSSDSIGGISEQSLNGFIGYIMIFLMIIICGFAISLVNSILSKDENNETYEIIFSGPISRFKYLLQSYFVLIISVIFICFALVSSYTISAKVAIEDINTNNIITYGLAISIMPMLFLFLSVLLHSINRKFYPCSWIYFVFCIIITMFSDILKTPDWLNNLAVTYHFSTYPIDFTSDNSIVIPLIITTLLCLSGFIASLLCYKKRDLS